MCVRPAWRGNIPYDEEEVAGYILRILDSCMGEDWNNLEAYLSSGLISSLCDDLAEVLFEGSDKDMRHSIYMNEDLSSNMRRSFRFLKEYFRDWITDYYSGFDYGLPGNARKGPLEIPDGGRSHKYKSNIADVLSVGDAFLIFNYALTLKKVYRIDDGRI